jgi:hypothetical protein
MGDDYVHAVQNENHSLSEVALEAQRMKRLAQYTSDPNKITVQKKNHTGLYTFFIVILLLSSLTLIGYKFVFSPKTPDPYAQFAVKAPILPNEQIGINSSLLRVNFDATIIRLATETPVEMNDIVHIYFTDGEVLRAKDVDEENTVKITSITNLFSLLSPNIPKTLARSLDQTNYVFGLYGLPNNERSQFLLLKTKNYANTFSGMLSWEKTMVSDLQNILQINTVNEELHVVDRLYFNKDVRVIETRQKETILLYSFLDSDTILITKDPDIFRDLTTRYHQSPSI